MRSLIAPHVDVNSTDADGSTALHWAAQRDNVELVDLLLAAGANAKAATRYNITPLSLACMNGNAAIVERLLKAGADPNAASEEGETALMTAALNGKPDAVKVLLAMAPMSHAKDPVKGQTALMWAASEGNTAAVKLLLEPGADIKAKSKGGFTPLLFAVRKATSMPRRPCWIAARTSTTPHRRNQRAEHGHRECLFRTRLRSAGSRRRSECNGPARLGAAHDWRGCENPAPTARPESETRRMVRQSPTGQCHAAGAREEAARKRARIRTLASTGRIRSSTRKAAR